MLFSKNPASFLDCFEAVFRVLRFSTSLHGIVLNSQWVMGEAMRRAYDNKVSVRKFSWVLVWVLACDNSQFDAVVILAFLMLTYSSTFKA